MKKLLQVRFYPPSTTYTAHHYSLSRQTYRTSLSSGTTQDPSFLALEAVPEKKTRKRKQKGTNLPKLLSIEVSTIPSANPICVFVCAPALLLNSCPCVLILASLWQSAPGVDQIVKTAPPPGCDTVEMKFAIAKPEYVKVAILGTIIPATKA